MGKRIIPQRRGRGGMVYRSPSHRHKGKIIHPDKSIKGGEVTDLFHDPGHTAPVAEVTLENGDKANLLAFEGEFIGQEVDFRDDAPLEAGNTVKVGRIPEGAMVFNVESKPGDGGKFARAAGTGAVIVSHGAKTVIRLPSERFKSISNDCRATIGRLAGGGRPDKPFAKSGKKFHTYRSKAKRYFKVSGVAMNAVDHPHGSGRHAHVGKPSTVSVHAPPGRKVGRLSPKRHKKAKARRR